MRCLLIAAFVCATLASGISAAQDPFTLEERMTEDEFRAAGLDRLSADQLASLNRWLQRRNLSAAQPPSGGNRGFRSNSLLGDSGGAPMASRAIGEQTQLSKGSIVTLENGQVWKVTEGDLVLREAIGSQRISVESGFLGSWFLKVDGYNQSLRVTRVR